MAPTSALIQCDDAEVPAAWNGRNWSLRKPIHAFGKKPTINLHVDSLADIVADVVDGRASDLVKIASYAYAADQEVSRGGSADVFLAGWNRMMALCVPVSDPAFWNQSSINHELVDTLDFLTGDTWQFHFSQAPSETSRIPLHLKQHRVLQHPDSVVLFSGGADSLCTTVDAIAARVMRPVLVSHRSSTVITSHQLELTSKLRQRFDHWGLPHLSFWIHRLGSDASDSSQRTRGFLFAALGAAIAGQIGVQRVLLGDNGFVSINPPISGQLVGTLTSRATHPGFLYRFNRLCALIARDVVVENPLQSQTRAEALGALKQHDCGDLLRLTLSCSRIRGLPANTPQCGTCSQCVDRRIGTIAAGLEEYDPADRYKVDLFTQSLAEGEARTISESLVRFSRRIEQLSLDNIFIEIPELTACLVPRDPDLDGNARMLASVVQRHATTVLRVLAEMIARHKSVLSHGTLPPDCLLSLALRRESPGAVATAGENAFVNMGTAWRVTFSGTTAYVNNINGMSYLGRLLERLGRELDPGELESGHPAARGYSHHVSGTDVSSPNYSDALTVDRSAPDPVLDRTAIRQFSDRVAELERQKRTLGSSAHGGQITEIDDELEALRRTLSAATGLRNRPRTLRGPDSKRHDRVTKALRRAIQEVDNRHPDLGSHLRSCMTVGVHSCYRPHPVVNWNVQLVETE